MAKPSSSFEIDLERGLAHLARAEDFTPQQAVDSFLMTCLHADQPVPMDKAREVLEAYDFSAEQLREIAERFVEIAAIHTMPGHLPPGTSKYSSYLKIALMAATFAHSRNDPEIYPELLEQAELPSGRDEEFDG